MDRLLRADGPQLIGADANADALAWDGEVGPDFCGDFVVRWWGGRAKEFYAANSGECARFADRHGRLGTGCSAVHGLRSKLMGDSFFSWQRSPHYSA